MALQFNYEQEILQLRIEIKQLIFNLGQSEADFCLFGSKEFNQDSYNEHKQLYSELQSKWNDVTNELDCLLDDLHNAESIDIYECKSDDGIQKLHDINHNDILSWTSIDGKKYTLFNAEEMEYNNKKYKEKYHQSSIVFRQFRKSKALQLKQEKLSLEKGTQTQITMIKRIDDACSFTLKW